MYHFDVFLTGCTLSSFMVTFTACKSIIFMWFLVSSKVPVNNSLLTGSVQVNNSLLTSTPKKQTKLRFSSSLLYGTPASSAESQHPEAWPASIYRHLREGYLRKKKRKKRVPVNKELLTSTVPVNNFYQKPKHKGVLTIWVMLIGPVWIGLWFFVNIFHRSDQDCLFFK